MGLMGRAKHRLGVWQWRARYWWLDTQQGEDAQRMSRMLAALVIVVQIVRATAAVAAPGDPYTALVWWVWLLITAIASLLVYALMPKVEQPKPNEGNLPTVEDGQAVLELHGPYRINDEFILAQQVVGRVPIKSGGKK